MTTLDNILDFTGGENFYRFGNSDGKYWIMPVRGMRTAMNLYQPSGIKGKMLKDLLPLLHWLPPVRKAIHAEQMRCSLKKELHTLLCKVFGVKGIEFSIFEGTPSASQKMILQISRRKRLLGYCKVSDRAYIFELFKKEAEDLNWLKMKGIKGIPEVLFCGEHSGLYIFIQATNKSASSKTLHKLTAMHTDFLNHLHKATTTEIPYIDSDFFLDIQYLKSILDNIPKEDRPIFKRGIEHIENHYRKEKIHPFSFFHGDFTPWNMYIEDKQLQVFDFEFSARTFPPRMDLVHYFLQILILEKKQKAEDIHPELEKFKKEHNINSTLTICYLMHILSFYFRLYNGSFNTNDNGYIIWCTLLRMQLNITR